MGIRNVMAAVGIVGLVLVVGGATAQAALPRADRTALPQAAEVALPLVRVVLPQQASSVVLPRAAEMTLPKPPPPTDVAGCEQGCTVAFDLQLPDDVRFVGLNTVDGPTGLARNLLVYLIANEVHDIEASDELGVVQDAVCGYSGDAQRCTASFGIGAHSSVVRTMLLTGDRGIEVTDFVGGDAPDAQLTDLDGDGHGDATMRMSTYDAAYAGAPQYWETYLEKDGRFVHTGCGPLEKVRGSAPTAPLTGPCPQG